VVNPKNRRFVAGLVCLLSLFAFVPAGIQAEEAAPVPQAVTQEAGQAAPVLAEGLLCQDEGKPAAGAPQPAAPGAAPEGALFRLPVPPSSCPVSCEPNACTWACGGGPRTCKNNCCVCLL
jgi:hypothetical protein